MAAHLNSPHTRRKACSRYYSSSPSRCDVLLAATPDGGPVLPTSTAFTRLTAAPPRLDHRASIRSHSRGPSRYDTGPTYPVPRPLRRDRTATPPPLFKLALPQSGLTSPRVNQAPTKPALESPLHLPIFARRTARSRFSRSPSPQTLVWSSGAVVTTPRSAQHGLNRLTCYHEFAPPSSPRRTTSARELHLLSLTLGLVAGPSRYPLPLVQACGRLRTSRATTGSSCLAATTRLRSEVKTTPGPTSRNRPHGLLLRCNFNRSCPQTSRLLRFLPLTTDSRRLSASYIVQLPLATDRSTKPATPELVLYARCSTTNAGSRTDQLPTSRPTNRTDSVPTSILTTN
ncbi:putative uncharacterized protein ENSP00000383309 [Rhodamnia argentea]|uniref:Uncharacterized protein n=1 Tax=Rhodamnia argentea TaxID=178133 RepID=A0A8B8N4Z9_9MYRT|nr:putative uncharacterized protein ENSP00000383309 [Rhodamnia argentea]